MHGCRNSNACKITSKSLAHWNRLCCSKCGCRIPETNCRRCRRAKWAEEPKSPPSLESPGHHRSLSCSGNFETVFHRLLFQIANKSLFLVWCSKHLKMPVPVMLQYVFQAVRWVDPVSRVAIIEENCTFYCVLWSQYNETHSISYSIHIEWYISKTKLILSQPFLSNNNCLNSSPGNPWPLLPCGLCWRMPPRGRRWSWCPRWRWSERSTFAEEGKSATKSHQSTNWQNFKNRLHLALFFICEKRNLIFLIWFYKSTVSQRFWLESGFNLLNPVPE